MHGLQRLVSFNAQKCGICLNFLFVNHLGEFIFSACFLASRCLWIGETCYRGVV